MRQGINTALNTFTIIISIVPDKLYTWEVVITCKLDSKSGQSGEKNIPSTDGENINKWS